MRGIRRGNTCENSKAQAEGQLYRAVDTFAFPEAAASATELHWRKGIAKVFDAVARDRDNVEPKTPWIRPRAADVVPRGAAQRQALVGIHSAFRRTAFIGRSGFHFDEHQRVAGRRRLARDEIDFTAALRRPPVSRDDQVPKTSQIAVRQILSAFAGISVLPVAQAVGQAVKQRQRVQTRTPLTCPGRRSKDNAPRIAGTGGTH